MPDYNFLLATRLSQDQQLALEILQRISREAGLNLYLTGGPMRDLLTGNPVRFLNFTTEGDPLVLAKELKAVGAERLSLHPEQRSLNCSLRGCRLRVSAARGEGGAPGTIVEDLRRRGLTLNSIGLSLNLSSRGLPLDPTNGAADIEARLIRMNHPYVFFEDPMVLLRAVRLATRLGFNIEERTMTRLESAKEGNYLARASGPSKGQELEAIVYEPDPAAVLRALDKDQWLAAAFGSGVRAAKMDLNALARLSPVVESWEQLGLTVDAGLAAMPFIFGGLAPSDQSRLAELLPSRHLAQDWRKVRAEAQTLEKRLIATNGAGTWLRRAHEAIEKVSPEAVVYATLESSKPKAGKKLKDFQSAALQLRQRLPLGILRSFDLAPHSLQAEEILRPWYRRLLSGETLSDAELSEGVRKAVTVLRPPPPAPPAAEALQPRRGRRGRAAAVQPPPSPAAKSAAPAPVAGKPAVTPRTTAPPPNPRAAGTVDVNRGGAAAHPSRGGAAESGPRRQAARDARVPSKARAVAKRSGPHRASPAKRAAAGKKRR